MTRRSAICLCADRNMLIPAMFVANAVRAQSTPAQLFDIFVFIAAGEATQAQRNWFADRGIGLVEDLDLSPLDNLPPSPTQRVTKATFIRLLVPQFLAGRYDVALYLDCDLTIHSDVGRILTLDIGNFAVAATPAARIWAGWTAPLRERDHGHFRALGMTEPYRFFNTGILLIDVRKWNEAELGTRTLHFYRRNSALCMLPDEHALNAVLDGRMSEISPVWNMRIGAWSHKAVRDHVNPVIVHYDGPRKPWRLYGDGEPLPPLREAYRSYETFLAGTPWANWLDGEGRPTTDGAARGDGGTGQFGGLSAQDRDAYALAYLEFCAKTDFADVAQGIVRRDGSCLRLS